MLKNSVNKYLCYISEFVGVAILLVYKFEFVKDVSTGTLLAMYMYSQNYSDIFSMVSAIRIRRKDMAALNEPIDAFLSKIEVASKGIEIEEPIEKIQLEDVSIGYGNEIILSGVNKEFKKGGIYLLEGPSGSGKSSLLNAILGEVGYEGKVLYNGINIDDFKLEGLQKKIGAILQDVYLFSASIKENILLFNKDYDEGKLLKVASELGLEDNERNIGSSEIEAISGGEKKRIALARLLMQMDSKDVIILDETFANIDYAMSESILNRMLPELKNKIVLMITHEKMVKEFMLKNGAEIYDVALDRRNSGSVLC